MIAVPCICFAIVLFLLISELTRDDVVSEESNNNNNVCTGCQKKRYVVENLVNADVWTGDGCMLSGNEIQQFGIVPKPAGRF